MKRTTCNQHSIKILSDHFEKPSEAVQFRGRNAENLALLISRRNEMSVLEVRDGSNEEESWAIRARRETSSNIHDMTETIMLRMNRFLVSLFQQRGLE